MTIGVPEPVRQHFQVLDTEALKQSTPSECENKGNKHLLISKFQFADVLNWDKACHAIH